LSGSDHSRPSVLHKDISVVLAGYLILILMALVAVAAVLGVRNYPLRIARWVLALGLALGVAGVILVAVQARGVAENRKLRNWPTVTGTVISSEVIGIRAFRPNIVYEYVVGGETYRDSTSLNPPSFGNRNTREGEATALTEEYSVGREVLVHYDPQQPSNSLLRISPDWAIYGKMGLGGTLFGIAIFCLLGYLVQKRE
jgi:hypothetical protein